MHSGRSCVRRGGDTVSWSLAVCLLQHGVYVRNSLFMSAVGDLVALYIIPRVCSATDSVITDHISDRVMQSGRWCVWCVCVSMYVDNNFRTK